MLALAAFAKTTDDGREVVLYKTSADTDRAILLVPGLVQNRFTFEVPTRSLPRFLGERGFTVYVVELFGRGSKRRFSRGDRLTDYADKDLSWAIERVASRHKSVSLLGHSMGGIISLLLDDATLARLSKLAVVASPLFVDSRSLTVDAAFSLARPLARRLGRAGVSFPGHWLTGPLLVTQRVLDVPGLSFPFQFFVPGSLEPDALRFFLRRSFHQDSLQAVAELLDPTKHTATLGRPLSVPEGLQVLVMGSVHDRLASKDGVLALYDRIATPSAELDLLHDGEPMGHVDMLVGKHAPQQTWPRLLRFFQKPPL